MNDKRHTLLVGVYVMTNLLLVGTNRDKYDFLLLGVLGQILLMVLCIDVYLSKKVWQSFHTYGLMYLLYVLSFSCMDVFFYLHDPTNFSGKIHSQHKQMFIDFVYVNISTISTIGYGDITASSTLARSYFCYKMVMAIFIITFMINIIVVRTKS